MIRFNLEKNKLRVEQITKSYTIYLDTCVFDDIAQNLNWKNRLANIFSKKSLTLLLSLFSIIESVKKDDVNQFRKFIELIKKFDYGLINANFFDVISKENNKQPMPAFPEKELLIFIEDNKNQINPFDLESFFKEIWKSKSEINKIFEYISTSFDPFLNNVQIIRNKIESDKKYKNSLKRINKADYSRTEYILKKCMRFLVTNRT